MNPSPAPAPAPAASPAPAPSAAPFNQNDVIAMANARLAASEKEIRAIVDRLEANPSDPLSQSETLLFQFALQQFTLIGQFASAVQKELHEAIKAILARL